MYRKILIGASALLLPIASVAVVSTQAGATAKKATAPSITGVTVSIAGETSPLEGGTALPYGAGFDITGLSEDCTTSPVTVTLTVANANLTNPNWGHATDNSANVPLSNYVTVAGWNGPDGILPPEACNVTTDPTAGTISFNVATAPALPTPTGYAKGLALAGTITIKDPANALSSKAAKTSFTSGCGAQPAANTPGEVGTATGTTDEGDANTLWANVTLDGTIIAFNADQPFCSSDLGVASTGAPAWADNYAVEVAPVSWNQTSFTNVGTAKAPKYLYGGNISGAKVSFTYTEDLTLDITQLTQTWTIKSKGATFGNCDLTNGDTGTCTVSGNTVTVTDTSPHSYSDGDTVASPTFKLENVLGKAGSTIQLIPGAVSATVSISGQTLPVVFAPASTANGKFAAPNALATITS